MRKLILMTSAAIIAPLSGLAEDITCTATPNCADLGYTSTTSCDKGVKCPWGEAWYCPPSPPEVCEIGSILYSDMTCYKEVQAGKTPIGVVVYVDGLGGGQALALDSIGSYKWSSALVDISGLTNYSSSSAASTDYASCENSKIIMAAGDQNTYPAVWAANEYSTEGTKAGDWCLPAAGIFTLYYNNQEAINAGFEKVNGTQFTTKTFAWSTSENITKSYYFGAWGSYFSYSDGLYSSNKYNSGEVRPVFEFVQTFEGVCKASQQYLCKGENETGGVGNACGGKYVECLCAKGYAWKNGKCVPTCGEGKELGYILYSDMTRSAELDNTKTPIGVVVCSYINGGGQALALNSVDSQLIWGPAFDEWIRISYTTSLEASQDYASCENSKMLIKDGDKNTYPAVWAAHEYKTEGTEAGDWCLPAGGIITTYYNNQNIIDTGFERAGGTKFTNNTYVWSSSEQDWGFSWIRDANSPYGLRRVGKYLDGEVRPVIEF